MPNQYYPTAAEVDSWCDALVARADAAGVTACLADEAFPQGTIPRHTTGHRAVRFVRPDGSDFFGFWQPVFGGGPAALLIHVPGYGAEMSAHPELAAAGFNVLHVNPLGYCAPEGPREDRKRNGNWPVLPDTALTLGEHGYIDWLADALTAVQWATAQPCVQANRLGTFGTSQGGGGALLLASLLRDRGAKAVGADLPFLTDFVHMYDQADPGAYGIVQYDLQAIAAERPADLPGAWRALGYIDTLSHAHRLTMPTLLTAGSWDNVCPPPTIQALFELLPATRAYLDLHEQGHAYTVPFLRMMEAWFRLYL